LKATISLALIFPLTLFAVAAQNVQHLDTVFTGATRWALLAALALFLLWRRKLMLASRTALAGAVVAWIGWVSLTTLWSDVPLLSAMKSLALGVSVLALLSGGIFWAQYVRSNDPLSYLAPLVVLALFTGLFGLGVSRAVNGGVQLFRGLSDSENGFAVLIAASLPYPLYAAGRTGSAVAWPRRAVWLVIATLLVGMLVATRSRGGEAAAACVLAAFAFAAMPRKVFLAGVVMAAASALAAGGLWMSSSHTSGIAGPTAHFLGKGHDGDLLQSRRYVWQVSSEAALEGGLIGIGEGVSAGASPTFEAGASASGYGREKGDSPLAMVEETGLIGLAIYLGLLWRLFRYLISGAASASGEVRTQLILLIGALAGLLLQSLVEAWWTSPGSIESVLFWSAAGVAIGLVRRRQLAAAPPARSPADLYALAGTAGT
jgi:hypothetical protein